MQALEKRLTEAEGPRGQSGAKRGAGRGGPRRARRAIGPARNAFNPGISLILQGTWARTSQDPNNFAITGFVPSGGEVGPPKRSFGLGESELAIAANIDPYFRGVVIASLTPENTVEVEEAYFQTLALPKGFTLKAGRFLVRHRLPERNPPARVGFPGRAAAVQGVSSADASSRTACR